MRGGKSHLRGFDERERASWLRIRSTHLESCRGALLAPLAEPQKPDSERNGKQIEQELERGSRICFQFDSGPAVEKYLGPSMRPDKCWQMY